MTKQRTLPVISIIIPTYKRHKNLVKRAVLSALNQTYKNIEVIIVDDNASPDNASYRNEVSQLIDEIGNKALKIVFNKKNLGGALSRNTGLEISNGSYIAFLDDDDVFLPDKIMDQYNHIIQNDLDVSITDLHIFNEKEKIIDVRRLDLKSFDYLSLKKYHLTKQLTGTPRFLFKTKSLTDVGGFDDVLMGQEWFLIDKLINKKIIKFGYLPVCNVKVYRTKSESISNSVNKLIGENKIYQTKLRYSSILNLKEKRYLRFRHYVIVCLANKRNHKFLQFLLYCIMIVTHFPLNFIKELVNMFNTKKYCKYLNKINSKEYTV